MGFLSSLFGVKDRTPATTTNVVSQKLPAEIAPAVKRVVDEATSIYEAEKARGYDPYTGETIAPLTAEEEQAMAGIAGLVGTATPLIEESLETYRTGAEKFTPETAQEYMSPYQRAVTDIEKREAGRQFDIAQQARDAQAAGAGAGSLMGTRSAILEAEAARNQQQLLSDIEARGLQSAFQNAQQQFEAQKARERQMAGDVARTGTGLFQAGLTEQGALQTVGEQKRELGQSALDEAYARFLEERSFPQQTLADFTTTIYGNPLSRMPQRTTQTSEFMGAPSTGQQLLGLGLAGLNIYGAGTAGGNPFSTSRAIGNLTGFKKEGGPIGDIVYRQNSGGLIPVMPVAKKRTSVAEEIRNLTGQLSAADPTQKKIIQSKINELKTVGGQDPSRKVGRIEEEFKAKTAAIGNKSAVKEAGISDLAKVKKEGARDIGMTTRTGIENLESKLQQAATDRGITVGQLKQQLAKLEGAIPATGITGIRKALQSPTLATTLIGVTEDTMETQRQAKIDAAKRGSDTAKLLAKLGLSNIDKQVEGETKIGEKRIEADVKEKTSETQAETDKVQSTWNNKLKTLDANEQAKINALVAQHNLQDEISGWPEKLQTKMLKLSKAKLDNDKIKAEIEKLKAEARAELTGKPMKASEFNALAAQAAQMSGIMVDLETGAIQIGAGGPPLTAVKALDIADTIILKANEFGPSAKPWVNAMKKGASKSALSSLAEINDRIPPTATKLTKEKIEEVKRKPSSWQAGFIENSAKDLYPDKPEEQQQFINNLTMVIKYYELPSS